MIPFITTNNTKKLGGLRGLLSIDLRNLLLSLLHHLRTLELIQRRDALVQIHSANDLRQERRNIQSLELRILLSSQTPPIPTISISQAGTVLVEMTRAMGARSICWTASSVKSA